MISVRLVSRPAVRVALAALVLGLAVPASADRFTTHLNPLEENLQGRSDALVGELTKDDKKDKKLWDGSLKKLGKNTTSLKKEIKLAKKVVTPLEKKKPEDVDFPEIFGGITMGLNGDIGLRADEVQQGLDELILKLDADKVQKAIDAIYTKLDEAGAEETFKKKLVRLGQAEGLATKAGKLLAKFEKKGGGGGGGGGGGNCPGVAFNQQEGASARVDGAQVIFDRWALAFVDPVPGSTTTIELTLARCNPPVEVRLTIPDPGVAMYNVGLSQGDVSAFYRESFDGFGTISTSGALDMTVFDDELGRLTATFNFDSGVQGLISEGNVNLTLFNR